MTVSFETDNPEVFLTSNINYNGSSARDVINIIVL